MYIDTRILDKLIIDFKKRFPEVDYFTQSIIINLINQGFCLGYDAHANRFKGRSKKVRRSDGKKYESIHNAALENLINEDNLRKAIKKKYKCAGYYWKII